MLLRSLETNLLQDTIECANWHVYPKFPGHRDGTGLSRMLILAVTALRSNVIPAVLLNESNRVTNFHVIAPRSSGHNDDVERRGIALPANEADLSRSSTPSLVQRRRGPRSLEPIVRPLAHLALIQFGRPGEIPQSRPIALCRARTLTPALSMRLEHRSLESWGEHRQCRGQ